MCSGWFNFLYTDGKFRAVPLRATKLHFSIYQRTRDNTLRCVQCLEEVDTPIQVKGAFARLVGRGQDVMYPDLCADAVDLMPECANLGPLPELAADVAAAVTDPSKLFPDGLGDVSSRCVFRAGKRVEYVALLLHQLRAKKVGLALHADAAAASDLLDSKKNC